MFNVGDQVRLVGYQDNIYFMKQNLGRIFTITNKYDGGKPAYFLNDGYGYVYREDWLELVEQETIDTDELEGLLGE